KDELSFMTGKEIEIREIKEETLVCIFRECYGEDWNEDRSLSERTNGYSKAAELIGGSVVQQVNSLIYQAIDMGASDIHMEPYEETFRVRFRLDGVLQHIGDLPLMNKDAVISRIKIMAHLDIAEKRRPQDGRIRIQKEGNDIDLRVSTLPTDY